MPWLRAGPVRRLPLAAGSLVLIAVLASCSRSGPVRASGTIELDEIDVSSLVGGRIARMLVDEGDTVRAGDTLAVLDRGEITAGLEAQAAQTERAAAQWRDLRAGPRAPEVLAARAELAAATSEAATTEAEYRRVQALFERQLASAEERERAQAASDAAAARRDAARQQLALLEAGYRRYQVEAAAHGAEAARADLLASRSRASELVLTSPVRGVVLLRNFEAGEVAGPAQPIVTVGDPERLWMRVYVPAPDLPRVSLGSRVEVSVRGIARRFPGRVVEIATKAEFTPRAALTEEERANLVFGVRVRLDPTRGVLKPGLPADVVLPENAAASAP